MTATSLLLFFRRHALIAAALIGAIVFSLGWFLALEPARARLAAERSLLRSLEEERASVEEGAAAFDRLRSAIADVRPEEFAKIDRTHPRGRDVPRLILELEAFASETGILLKDVALQEGRGDVAQSLPQGVKSIDLVVTVSGGDYATLKRFLEAIEKSGRILDVRNFTFARGLQSYTINVQAYYRE